MSSNILPKSLRRPSPRPLPIISIAIAFMAGILIGHYFALPTWTLLLVVILTLVAAALSLRPPWKAWPVLFLLVAWTALGSLAYQVRYQYSAKEHIVRYSADLPVLVRLRGQALDDSRWAPATKPWPSDPSLYFHLRLSQIWTTRGWTAVNGTVPVRIKQPFRSLITGQRLELLGTLSRYLPPQNPGQFNWPRYSRFKDRLCRLSVQNGAVVRQLAQASRRSSPPALAKLRRQFSAVLTDADFSPESNSLLKAMVLGERDQTFRRLNQAFQTTGLFHFLCVSGLHLGVLAGFFWILGSVIALPRRTTALLVMAAIIFYALLVPARAPIIRAAIVVSILCLAEITGRQTRRLHCLALAALLVLLWRPAEIFNIGFQLSFTIVAALILLCPRLARMLLADPTATWISDPGTHPRPKAEQIGRWLWLWLVRLLSTCIIAWFVAAPLILYHFGYFNPWAPLYSLLIAPLALATIVAGYLTAVLGWLLPLLAEPLRTISLALADSFYSSATVLAKIPGTIQNLPAPALPLLILFYAWLILLALRPKLSPRFVRLPLTRAWMLPPFLALLAAYIFLARPVKAPNTLALHLLSVGNAQAAILELPNGAALACDLGSTISPDLTERTVMPYLRSRHLRRIDALLISHPNWDHYSGAADLIETVSVPALMVSPYFQDNPHRQGLSRLLASSAPLTVLANPATLTGTGQARLEILWPPPRRELAPNLSSNDSSLVVRISYAGKRILLTGDISATAQQMLLTNGTDLRADVLIWPHHGGLVNTTAAFFQAVDPSIVLVSCGPDRAERIRTLAPASLLTGRELYTTADRGALAVLLSPDALQVLPFVSP